MNPVILNQAARLAPIISRFMSRGASFATPFWRTAQIDVPEVNAHAVTPRDPRMPQVPISGPQAYEAELARQAHPSPMDRIAQGHAQFAPSPMAAQSSPMDSLPWPFGPIGAPQAAHQAPQAHPAAIPMPQARPAEAPDTSFFMRNALMQRDPMTGAFLDPAGAASVKGPDLIAKMMGYLHNRVA